MSIGAGPPGGDGLDPREAHAAEYVLGTLPAEARAALERERAAEPATDALIRAWEARLSPLGVAVPAVAPPPRVWEAIARALPVPPTDAALAALRAQVRRWRVAAAAAGLVAAGLAAVLVLPRVAPAEWGLRGNEPAVRYMAVVTSGGGVPALIVSVDTADGTARVRPVGARAPDGRSLELWYVADGQAPKALGLVGTGSSRIALPPGSSDEGVIAVSSEPPGGSPTGQPTGQVLYTGKLFRE